MRATPILMASVLLVAGLASTPTVAAEPEPPQCADGPILDLIVVAVWMTRSCSIALREGSGSQLVVPDTPDEPDLDKDIYLPNKPDPCPVMFSGEYDPLVSVAGVTVYYWHCTFDSGPPP